VVDASVALSWCFADEKDPYATRVLHSLSEAEAIVPAIWPLEVSNALVVAERRKRLKPAEALRFIALVGSLGLRLDTQPPARVFEGTLPLARRSGLSAYDASYLELTMREDLPLATLDENLRKAARKLGVKLFAA
jgi:predicted nucleic acid-binding protein